MERSSLCLLPEWKRVTAIMISPYNLAFGQGQTAAGLLFDSNTEFILPSGAAFAPDASWVLKTGLASLTKEEKEQFGRLCPDFVVELKSPSDRLRSLKSKMEEWMANGAQLGWLIEPEKRTVYVFRPGRSRGIVRYRIHRRRRARVRISS